MVPRRASETERTIREAVSKNLSPERMEAMQKQIEQAVQQAVNPKRMEEMAKRIEATVRRSLEAQEREQTRRRERHKRCCKIMGRAWTPAGINSSEQRRGAMGNLQCHRLIQYIRQLAGAPSCSTLTDRQLLESFASSRSENAFAALVERHGAMAFAVCRRVLNHVQDAEDAFQATFLVLARRAGTVRWQTDIGDWIHAVAYRTALKARGESARRRRYALPLIDMPAVETTADLAWQELRSALDDEVRRLPAKYRRPVVLCYFEDKTYTEAAEILGIAEGTVSSRLARARERLRRRLVRRGLTLSAALLSTTVAREALAASVPANLLHLTIRGVVLTAAGNAGAASSHVAALEERVLKTMFLIKLKIAMGILLGIGLVGGGAGVVSYRPFAKGPQAASQGSRSVQEDRLRENEQLRREIEDLKDQVKALTKRQVNPEASGRKVLYQGKPPAFWIEQLQDRAPDYRAAAVAALGGIAEVDRSVVPLIIESLKDKDSNVREAAAASMANLGTDAIPMLAKVLKDKNKNARVAALKGLFTIGCSGQAVPKMLPPVIAEALKDDDYGVRRVASDYLSKFGYSHRLEEPSAPK
jgi:RNA polymerase sigma factor (sigma-70 family)